MRQATRFLVLLVVGSALLTWGSYVAVWRATRAWFERDLTDRAVLVVAAARRTLGNQLLLNDQAGLHNVVRDVTRDDLVLGATICGADGQTLVRSPEYPTDPRFRCEAVAPHAVSSEQVARGPWTSVVETPTGGLHVTAVPLTTGGQVLGSVVILHDLTFLRRAQSQAKRYVLAAFAIVAFGTILVTIVAARLAWRGWTLELRRIVRGEPSRPPFAALVQDVRELVRRIADEEQDENAAGRWTPTRLKHTLQQDLHGERVLIVANREPYIHDRKASGEIVVSHPASGLVTALEPVMRACSGVWIAHGSGSADRDTADPRGRLHVPPDEPSYWLRRVWLSQEEEQGYYYGLANEGLWPLCHVAHVRPRFRSSDWTQYQIVNERFADAVSEESDVADPIVLVQDYHFALLPRLLRARMPRATILTFWHIPWPNAERVAICPWRAELLQGLLGSNILGFHTQMHCNNFLDTVDRYLESRIDREQFAVHLENRETRIRPYPISVDWPNRWAVASPPVEECRRTVRAELGLRPDTQLGVGVDRLDYTKGIEERLLAVERLLERFPSFVGRFTFVQLAAPSRTGIDEYRQLDERVARQAERIGTRFATRDWRPVILHRSHHEPPEVFRYYRAADVCYVSSLHDGMNLVAKEFVAARDDERGVLVLSTFTGAARDLTEALTVNPYDLDEASDALAAALTMPLDEQRDRMQAMRSLVSEFNVYRWAGRMLLDAARLRRREQLRGRLNWRRSAPDVLSGR